MNYATSFLHRTVVLQNSFSCIFFHSQITTKTKARSEKQYCSSNEKQRKVRVVLTQIERRLACIIKALEDQETDEHR